ncbi:LPXTG cell wall anchor domain-containing protein [Streptomyces tubercidicus]|uniref:LPXTG cell wall anchor domain-containing protein n=1 Tax=Streptomyces tubercidicus TaxID=47759 RepID=UPI0034655EE3
MRHPRFSRLTPVTALAALLAVGPASSAAAHGDTIYFGIVTTQPDDGRVRTVATWENDKDPVTDSIAGTLSAVDVNGRSLGPWKLIPVAGAKATYTTRQALPPGRWKVTVDCGFPDLGHGAATVDVPAAGAKPTDTPTSAPADPPKDRPKDRPATETSAESTDGRQSTTSSSAPIWAGAAAATALLGGAAFLIARRRRSGR